MKHQRLVLLLAALLFLWWLGGRDLWAPNEPYFAEGAREMVVDGEWAVPHVNGVVSTDKPPFFFWLIALVSLPFGKVTLWTSRLPSVFAALGTLAITMRLGRRFYGNRTAALAGLVLATSYMFWEQARWVQTDAVLCLLIWIALAAFVEFRAGDRNGLRAGLLFWLSLALAVLTKGPVGLLLPLGIAVVVLLGDRKIGLWRAFAPWAGPGLFLLVIVSWMLLATFGSGGEYSVWGALKEHFVDRGIHGLHHKRPPWYYLEVLPAMIMPWTFLLPGAMVLAWRRRLSFDRFLLAAAWFVVIFFSISTEKRELYALPALPAIALMTAALVANLAGWNEAEETGARLPGPRWITLGQTILGALLIGTAIYAPIAAGDYDFVPQWAVVIFAVLLSATGIATIHAAAKGPLLRSVLSPAAGFAVLYLFVASVLWPAFEPRKSARAFSLAIEKETREYRKSGLPIVSFWLENLPQHFAFYGNGLYTLEVDNLFDVQRHLERPETVFAVVQGGKLEGLPPVLLDRLHTVAEARLARKQVLLITNTRPGDTKAVSAPTEGSGSTD
ncbi:MAG: glycosyltransferase family 39 protein [bacterium]|nr:glycosyltransferase family 39 protein [bacterium]